MIPIDSTLEVIDAQFGDSWEVPVEDWLFSGERAINVRNDIVAGSPFTPVYTPEFESEELRVQAEEVKYLVCTQTL